jgi:hypothetical protein
MKTKNIAFSVLLIVAAMSAGYAQTPRYAATTKTWFFGNQTWSDAIQVPECNKSSFAESDTEPQCRSYADPKSGKSYYYYNWPYVNGNGDKLCPKPWRVPGLSTLVKSARNISKDAAKEFWGYGGLADGGSMQYVSTCFFYWSSAWDERNPELAYCCDDGTFAPVRTLEKALGFQVRCVLGK